MRCVFPLGVVAEKKIHGLPAFVDPSDCIRTKAMRQLYADCGGGCCFEGGDFRAGGRVLFNGRLDFTEGPPIAVK